MKFFFFCFHFIKKTNDCSLMGEIRLSRLLMGKYDIVSLSKKWSVKGWQRKKNLV